eukprot:g2880.t1
MIKRVFKKTNTPIRKNGTNGSRPKKNELKVTRVEHDFYPGEDKARPSGGMLLHGTMPVDSLGDVTTPSDTARRRDELLKTRATIDELRAAIRVEKTPSKHQLPVRIAEPSTFSRLPVKVATPSTSRPKLEKQKKKKKKKSTTKRRNNKPISFVTVPSTSVSTWDTSPPEKSSFTKKAVKLKRPAKTIRFTTVERTQETEQKEIRKESTNPFMNHDNRVSTTSKIVSPSSRDKRRIAIENMCSMLPESCNGRRILAALRQEDSDRDGRVTLREIRLAMKRLSESPYDIKNKVLIALVNAFGGTGDLIEIDAISDAVDSLKFEQEEEKVGEKDRSTVTRRVSSQQQHDVRISSDAKTSSPFHDIDNKILSDMPAMLRAAFHSKDLDLLSTSLLQMDSKEAQYWMNVAHETGMWNLEDSSSSSSSTHVDVDLPRRENNEPVISSSSSSSKRVLFSTPFHQQQESFAMSSPHREREILLEISTKLSTKNHRFREALRFYLGNPRSLDMTCEQFGEALNRMNIEINRQEFQSLVSKCSGTSSGRVDYTKLQALIASYEDDPNMVMDAPVIATAVGTTTAQVPSSMNTATIQVLNDTVTKPSDNATTSNAKLQVPAQPSVTSMVTISTPGNTPTAAPTSSMLDEGPTCARYDDMVPDCAKIFSCDDLECGLCFEGGCVEKSAVMESFDCIDKDNQEKRSTMTLVRCYSSVVEYVFTPIYNAFIACCQAFGRCLSAVWTTVFVPIGNAFYMCVEAVFTCIFAGFNMIWDYVFVPIGNVIVFILTGIGNIFNAIFNAISACMGAIFENVIVPIGNAIGIVLSAIGSVIGAFLSAIGNFLAAIWSAFTSILP